MPAPNRRRGQQEKIQTLLKVIRSKDFKDQVVDLGGYDVSLTGEVLSANSKH